MFLVIRVIVSEAHEVDGGGGGANEDDLHDGVVDADEVPEDVDIASEEDQEVQFLGFQTDTGTVLQNTNPIEENDNRNDVHKVRRGAKDVEGNSHFSGSDGRFVVVNET